MDKMLRPNEYRCCICGEIFEKGWTDEEAMDEMEKNFGVREKPTEDNLACDDCYQQFLKIQFS